MGCKQSHPWISFQLDLRRFPPSLWMKLGEAKSKCDHIAGVPLRPATAETLNQLFLAKGALATTAIEGNTLSEEQALSIVRGERTQPPSREYLDIEIENLVRAYNQIVDRILNGQDDALTPAVIKEFNLIVLSNLPPGEGVEPGVIRKHSVGVGNDRGAPAEAIEPLLSQLCEWMKSPGFTPWPAAAVEMAFVRAILAHLYLAWIHPFGDGNGRTARLVEFHILVQAGVPIPAAHLLSDFYNKTRSLYYQQLDRASRSGGDVIPFLEYAVQGLLEGLKEQIDLIKSQQSDVTWRNYVHETFKALTSKAAERQRHLVLDLSLRSADVPTQEITSVSARVAQAYAGKTRKTAARDLAALMALGLIEIRQGKVHPRKEIVRAFLPARRDKPVP